MQEVYIHFCHHKMSNWNTELSINIEDYEELGKIASETCAMLSEAYGTGNVRKLSVCKWHKQIEGDERTVEGTEKGSHLRIYISSKNTGKGVESSLSLHRALRRVT